MKIVLAALVRGYPSLINYKNLIKRNKLINKNIIPKVGTSIKLILFHEGNISLKHQNFINQESKVDYEFIDVSDDFIYDIQHIDKIPDIDRFGIGYRLMCKFNFYNIWNYISDYDYLIRVDEDVLVKKFNFNFQENFNSDFVFGTAKLSNETHLYTNKSLPIELQKLFKVSNLNFYNHKFPYTNFFITKINFWTNPVVSSLLKELADNQQQIIYRWGDLPILGSVLNFMDTDITILNKIKYSHLSHQNKLKLSKTIKS